MKQIGRYFLILVAVMALWNTVVIKPLKLFTVFLHELGHAAMAYIFGLGIQGIKLSPNESGYTLTQSKGWFSSFMIANGGYLGSVFFALLILYLKRTPLKKFILGTLALLFLGVSVWFSRDLFTIFFSAAFAAVVIVLHMLHNDKLNDWVIDIIGISSVAYAVYDTFVDTILLQLNLQFHLINWDKRVMTDAMQLAKLTHIPAIVWGIIWLVIALIAVNATLLKAPGSKSKR